MGLLQAILTVFIAVCDLIIMLLMYIATATVVFFIFFMIYALVKDMLKYIGR